RLRDSSCCRSPAGGGGPRTRYIISRGSLFPGGEPEVEADVARDGHLDRLLDGGPALVPDLDLVAPRRDLRDPVAPRLVRGGEVGMVEDADPGDRLGMKVADELDHDLRPAEGAASALPAPLPAEADVAVLRADEADHVELRILRGNVELLADADAEDVRIETAAVLVDRHG